MKLLRIELEEHAEVEHELAKRSHFCQRVIQKYKKQVKELEDELSNRNRSSSNKLNKNYAASSGIGTQ